MGLFDNGLGKLVDFFKENPFKEEERPHYIKQEEYQPEHHGDKPNDPTTRGDNHRTNMHDRFVKDNLEDNGLLFPYDKEE